MIDEVFQLVNFIADKEGRGYLPPGKFNLLAKVCQLEFISSRLGNIKLEGPNGVPPFGYSSTRRIDVDLRPFVYGPEIIPVNNQGNWNYPYGYMWPDTISKTDFTDIKVIDENEYPSIKKSLIIPPTEDYPVAIFRNPYGFVDPYTIGNVKFSYVKYPRDPVWGYDIVNNDPVYNESKSQDFTLRQISMMDITALILEKVGIYLDKQSVYGYSLQKQQEGT